VLPEEVPAVDLASIPDVMDPASNPLSGNLESMIKARSNKRKDELIEKMDRARRGEPLESIQNENIAINSPAAPAKSTQPSPVDEQLLNKQLKAQKQAGGLANSRMRSIRISHGRPKAEPAGGRPVSGGSQKAQAAMTSGPTPDTIRLARSNDLNVETVAREANRGKEKDGEVVIPLH
jgi:hypothetical protein